MTARPGPIAAHAQTNWKGRSATAKASSAAWSRRMRAENPQWNREKNARWKAANREKYLAHKRVEAALRFGKLARQPCERCGATDLVHAHHDDYARPLDVMWLCPTHHRERHRELVAEAVS